MPAVGKPLASTKYQHEPIKHMSQPSKDEDVIEATDSLMRKLLQKARDGDEVDFAVQIVQAATKWVAVKHKIPTPDEENAFDRYRDTLGGGEAASVAGLGASAPEPPARRSAVSTRATRATRSGTIRKTRTPLSPA